MEKPIVIQLYQFIANYTAYRHLYGHLNSHSGFLCRKCWLDRGGCLTVKN